MSSGMVTPHNNLLPEEYVRQACPVRFPRTTISILNGTHFLPTDEVGEGTLKSQLGQMSDVAFSMYAAIWFNTCPLKGISRGKMTSNAEMRSEAIITMYSSLIGYTSLTLPL